MLCGWKTIDCRAAPSILPDTTTKPLPGVPKRLLATTTCRAHPVLVIRCNASKQCANSSPLPAKKCTSTRESSLPKASQWPRREGSRISWPKRRVPPRTNLATDYRLPRQRSAALRRWHDGLRPQRQWQALERVTPYSRSLMSSS